MYKGGNESSGILLRWASVGLICMLTVGVEIDVDVDVMVVGEEKPDDSGI